ncbi:hypothetical protein BJX99DRAFT_219837 [Aspergillus californicus]
MPPLGFSSLPLSNTASVELSNATQQGLEVVCAWPVSGQYGPGTRYLYYVLIAACVFARKAEWLRSACLAGALLFPAIAALHGIVLAVVHVDEAIDMDVYGAFQLCSIGILAAPLTVRMSRTYFKDPRRNIIFLWTALILAGLLSITVEFFRAKSFTCTHDDFGNPISPDVSKFPYGNTTVTTCGLRCSVEDGPFSPIRGGSTNEIYVVPSPNNLKIGTVTLLAAGCCVPAIVSLLYIWTLILQETWNKRFGNPTETDRRDEPIEGTNGATVGKMLQINGLVRTVLSTVEAPVFAAAVLAIIVVGEINFWSTPVNFGTEPIASIGQWAPIVGAAFAILGSLYIFLTSDDANPSQPSCKCTCHGRSRPSRPGCVDEAPPNQPAMTTIPPPVDDPPSRRETPNDVGSRRRIAGLLGRLGNSLSIAAHDRLHDYEFKQGRALDFPEIPAEEQRNETLQQIRERYNHPRDSNGNITLSRVVSTASMASSMERDRSSTTSRGLSPRSSRQFTRSRSPSPFSASAPRRSDGDRGSLQMDSITVESPADDPPISPRKRQDTLEVPPHHGALKRPASISSVSSSSYTIPGSQASPTIIVSAEGDVSSASQSAAMPPSPDSPDTERWFSPRHGRRFTS